MCEITNLIEDTSDSMKELLKDMKFVHGKECGLDDRCPGLWVSDNAVVCKGDTRRLEYYGGFEYVTPESKIGLGNYTVYIADRDHTGRVYDVIERALGFDTEED